MQASEDPLASLGLIWDRFVLATPRIALALAILLVGLLLARFARRYAVRLLRWARLDDVAEKAGFEDFLMQGGVKHTTASLVAMLLYWMIVFGAVVVFLTMLGLTAAAQLLDRMILFIPNILIAVVILLFGAILSRLVGTVVFTYLSNMGSTAARPLGAVARYALLVFVIALAAEQLALNSEILLSGFRILFGALCLALALAFGLGGRRWAAGVLERFWPTTGGPGGGNKNARP
jgi:hypothetical protein